jgi:hypothetical protein
VDLVRLTAQVLRLGVSGDDDATMERETGDGLRCAELRQLARPGVDGVDQREELSVMVARSNLVSIPEPFLGSP